MYTFENMKICDYEEVYQLMGQYSGIRIRDTDSKNALMEYLNRNPQLSFVAKDKNKIIGVIFSGHDGRRGYLHHLVVQESHRKNGVGKKLVELCLDNLQKVGIFKTHIDVLIDNKGAINFWVKQGWEIREDIIKLSFNSSNNPNV